MDLKVDGIDDILQNLSRLNIDEAVESKALTKAGNVTRDAIKEEVPVDQGNLQKNIRVKRPKDGEAHVHTGRAYHAHLVEFGRSGGSTVGKNGRRVSWGPTSPNPFFTRGFESSKDEARQAMADEIRKRLKL